ncbi:MAG: hypothetical protein IJB34_01745 [Clostridia bacterium]|nr:hypothetical protein [Clostridia bacterium]
MKNNFKTVLKKVFKFDEEKLEDQGTFGYGEDVMQEFDKDDLMKKLVVFGMNNGFDKIKKPIKELADMKKKVYGNRKLKQSAAEDMLKKYAKIKQEVEKILPKTETGFKSKVLSFVAAAREKAEKLSDPHSDMFVTGLDKVLSESIKKLDELKTTVGYVLDESSVAAANHAKKILAYIDEWSDTRVLDIVETGKIKETKKVIEPLVEANKVARDWALMEEGVSVANARAEQELVKAYDKARDQLAVFV